MGGRRVGCTRLTARGRVRDYASRGKKHTALAAGGPWHDRVGIHVRSCDRAGEERETTPISALVTSEAPAVRARSWPPVYKTSQGLVSPSGRTDRAWCGLVARTSSPPPHPPCAGAYNRIGTKCQAQTSPGLDPGPGSAMSRHKHPIVPASRTSADPDHIRVYVGQLRPLRAGARGACPR